MTNVLKYITYEELTRLFLPHLLYTLQKYITYEELTHTGILD